MNTKDGFLRFLMGQVMKKSQGLANPKLTKELLEKRLIGIENESLKFFYTPEQTQVLRKIWGIDSGSVAETD